MIIKDESAAHQDTQDTQPPPPEYTEALVRPEPTYAQQPAPATQLQYPPQPSPYNQNDPTPRQRQAQIGQEYRNRREFLPLCSPELAELSKSPRSASSVRERRPRRNHDIRNMRHRLCRPVVSDRPGVPVVSPHPEKTPRLPVSPWTQLGTTLTSVDNETKCSRCGARL